MTIEQSRLHAVLQKAWRLLPAERLGDAIRAIRLDDLGQVHGHYDPETGVITLNRRLFTDVSTIDHQGHDAPRRPPWVSRALHTTIHELAHALGEATGLDATPSWYGFSGWEWTPDEGPGTGRYFERRPGWDNGPSPWRYRHGTWFARPYSTKSPHEDWADVVTYIALGWTQVFGRQGHGRDKLAYVRRYLWGDHTVQARWSGPGSLAGPPWRQRRHRRVA